MVGLATTRRSILLHLPMHKFGGIADDELLSQHLYLSGRRGCPFLTALAQRIRDGDPLSADGGDDDLTDTGDQLWRCT